MKSYKAAHKAKVIAKLDNVYAFDAGIFDWTKAYPDKAVLLGQTPVDTRKLISRAKLQEHTLPAAEFIRQANNNNALILDVRSRHQRDGFYVFSRYEESVSMEDKESLNKFIKQAKAGNKTLFIYDAVGKQVRWLQYYLEQQNAGPYYFMKGGAMAFFEIPENQLSNISLN
jgi:rhodanese-related sulfurtransferase